MSYSRYLGNIANVIGLHSSRYGTFFFLGNGDDQHGTLQAKDRAVRIQSAHNKIHIGILAS